MEITVGMKGTVSTLVEREDTAYEVGSGSLLVYATPCMVALMEGAACEAIADAIPEGKTSVGTALNISHLAATPVGLEVRAEAEVTEVEKNLCRLTEVFLLQLTERDFHLTRFINGYNGIFSF